MSATDMDREDWITVEETDLESQRAAVEHALAGAGIAVRVVSDAAAGAALQVPLSELDEALAILEALDGSDG